MKKSYLQIFLFATIVLLYMGCYAEKEKMAPIYVESDVGNYQVPDGYDSYTLFFATSYQFASDIEKSDYIKLKKVYQKFGKSIGKDNLAVWTKDPKQDELNIEMGKTYADRIYRWYGEKLSYSEGPYLVYFSQSPEYAPKENDFCAILNFKNYSMKHMIEGIEYIESSIRRNEISKNDIELMNYWIDLKSFCSNNSTQMQNLLKEIIIIVADKK